MYSRYAMVAMAKAVLDSKWAGIINEECAFLND